MLLLLVTPRAQCSPRLALRETLRPVCGAVVLSSSFSWVSGGERVLEGKTAADQRLVLEFAEYYGIAPEAEPYLLW